MRSNEGSELKNTRNVSFWIKSEMCVAFHSLFFVGNGKEASQFWGLEDQRKTVTIGCLKELILLDLTSVKSYNCWTRARTQLSGATRHMALIKFLCQGQGKVCGMSCTFVICNLMVLGRNRCSKMETEIGINLIATINPSRVKLKLYVSLGSMLRCSLVMNAGEI